MTDTNLGSSLQKFKDSDKRIAAVVMLAVLAGAGYGLLWLLPILIQLAQETITLGIEVVVGALLGALVWTNYENVWYAMLGLSRSIRRLIVHENPVGMLDAVIARLQKRLEEIADALRDATAAKSRIEAKVRNPKAAIDPEHAGMMDKAESEEAMVATLQRRGGSQTEINRHAANAARWRQSADSMQPVIAQLTDMIATLKKADEFAKDKMAERENARDVLVAELDARREGQKAVRSFKRFFSKSSDDVQILGMSIEEIELQSAQDEAEIDQFLDAIKPQLADEEVKKSAAAEQAMRRFQAVSDKKALPEPPVNVKEGVVVGEKQTTH